MRIKYVGRRDNFQHISGKNMNLQDIPDGICESIVLNDCIDFVDIKQVGQFMKTVASKLQPNGTLYISSFDFMEVSRLFCNNRINIYDYNEMCSSRISFWCLVTMKEICAQVGISVSVARLGGIGNKEYFIIGTKND